MSDVISEYQRWKQQGADLRVRAKQAMETRFRELLAEAVHIAEEYRADFGGALKPASPVTSFRYKASAHKAKKAVKKTAPPVKAAVKVEATPAPKANPKVAGLQKRLATAKKKLDDAKTSGGVTRMLEDKVYEIEDELRLANQ